jgi:hypothetical protein
MKNQNYGKTLTLEAKHLSVYQKTTIRYRTQLFKTIQFVKVELIINEEFTYRPDSLTNVFNI